MKKILISMLIGAMLPLCGCSHDKVKKLEVKAKESAKVQKFKTVYNWACNIYNDDNQERMLEYICKEAKAHPRELLETLYTKAFVNYVDFSKIDDGLGYKKLLEEELYKTDKVEKCSGSEYKVEKCSESEYKDTRKIDFKELKAPSGCYYEIEKLVKTTADCAKDCANFISDFSKIKGNFISDLLDNDDIDGEEFLKTEPLRIYRKAKEEQYQCLKKMKDEIERIR